MSDEARGLTKWQLALVVGVGAATVAGISLLAYVALRSGEDNAEDTETQQNRVESDPVGSPQLESGENDRGRAGISEAPNELALKRALDIKMKGNSLYKEHKFSEAIQCYQEAMSICPEENKEEIAKFHQNIAAVYDMMAANAKDEDEKASHMNSVMEHCSQALELNPRYTKALTRRLKVYESLGRKKDALLDVTRVIILDETQTAGLGETVARLLKSLSQEQAALHFPKLGPLAPTKHLVKTYLESFCWQDDLSEEQLRELWVVHKNKVPPPDQSESPEESHDIYEGFEDDPFVKAASMFRNHQYHGILEPLTVAVEKGSPAFRPHALLLRGTFYNLWRENDKALKDLEAAINTQGVSDELTVNALIKKADVYAGSGQMDKVKSCFDKCFVIDPTCPDALIHRARVNLESPEDPQALESVIEDLKEALVRMPESAYAAFSLATAYHRIASMNQSMQLLSQATAKFEEASKKFPDFTDGMVLYALFLQDMSQFQLAEDILNKALKMEPDNSTVHFSLGILNLVAQRNPGKAQMCMEKALSVDNSCIQAYDTLASLEIQNGNPERALNLYDKAIQFSRSQIELGQALVAREVIAAQDRVCKEYGVSMKELAARAMPTQF